MVEVLFSELGLSIPQCPVVWCDNQSAIALAQNPVFHVRTKHIEINVHFIRDKISFGALQVQYVPTTHQCADILTKALPFSQFDLLRSKLILAISPIFSLRGDVKNNVA